MSVSQGRGNTSEIYYYILTRPAPVVRPLTTAFPATQVPANDGCGK